MGKSGGHCHAGAQVSAEGGEQDLQQLVCGRCESARSMNRKDMKDSAAGTVRSPVFSPAPGKSITK